MPPGPAPGVPSKPLPGWFPSPFCDPTPNNFFRRLSSSWLYAAAFEAAMGIFPLGSSSTIFWMFSRACSMAAVTGTTLLVEFIGDMSRTRSGSGLPPEPAEPSPASSIPPTATSSSFGPELSPPPISRQEAVHQPHADDDVREDRGHGREREFEPPVVAVPELLFGRPLDHDRLLAERGVVLWIRCGHDGPSRGRGFTDTNIPASGRLKKEMAR